MDLVYFSSSLNASTDATFSEIISSTIFVDRKPIGLEETLYLGSYIERHQVLNFDEYFLSNLSLLQIG